MGQLSILADCLDEEIEQLEVALLSIGNRTASFLVKSLAEATPVDTSEALSNWVVGINQPAILPIGPRITGSGGSTQGPSIDSTVDEADRVLATRIPGEIIFVSNSAEHIGLLNDGSSIQAPEGFVEIQVIRADNFVGTLVS